MGVGAEARWTWNRRSAAPACRPGRETGGWAGKRCQVDAESAFCDVCVSTWPGNKPLGRETGRGAWKSATGRKAATPLPSFSAKVVLLLELRRFIFTFAD